MGRVQDGHAHARHDDRRALLPGQGNTIPDDETLGTVFFRGPQTEMEGIFFAKFPLAMLG